MDTVNTLLALSLAGVGVWIGFRMLRFVGAAVVVALSGIGDSER